MKSLAKIISLLTVIVLLITNISVVNAKSNNNAKITAWGWNSSWSDYLHVNFKTPRKKCKRLYVYKYGGKKNYCKGKGKSGKSKKWKANGLRANTLYSYETMNASGSSSIKKWFVPDIMIKEGIWEKRIKHKMAKFTMPSIKGISFYKVYVRRNYGKYKLLCTTYNKKKVKLKYKKQMSNATELYFKFVPYRTNGSKVRNLCGDSDYNLIMYK